VGTIARGSGGSSDVTVEVGLDVPMHTVMDSDQMVARDSDEMAARGATMPTMGDSG
jgi:hypothetical protein